MATIGSSPHWSGCCTDILPNLQHWFLEEVSRRIHSFSNLQLAIVRSCLRAFQKLYFHMRVRSVLCRSMLTFCVAKCLLFPQMPDPNTVLLATSHFVASAFCVAPAIISWKVSLSMASTLLQTRWHFRHSRSTCDVWQLLQASWLHDAISPNSFSYSGSYFKYRGECTQIFWIRFGGLPSGAGREDLCCNFLVSGSWHIHFTSPHAPASTLYSHIIRSLAQSCHD